MAIVMLFLRLDGRRFLSQRARSPHRGYPTASVNLCALCEKRIGAIPLDGGRRCDSGRSFFWGGLRLDGGRRGVVGLGA